jgi:hypothetical protein
MIDALGFLNVNDQNEVRLPVVKYLASQRASSIQTLVTYFIVHCRPPSFDQPDLPSTLPAGGLRQGTKCGAGFLASEFAWRNRHVSYCGLLKGNPRCEPLSSASRALWPGGSDFATQGSGRALAPVHLVAPSCVMPRKIWSGPVLPPPKFPGVAMESMESCLLAVGCWSWDGTFHHAPRR